jgi:hypothetical protein
MTSSRTAEEDNAMSPTATEQSFELDYWGEDEQWIAAEGHVPLVAFTRAADALAKEDGNLDDDELPSVLGGAVHQWFRPMTREWFDANSGYDKRADEMFDILLDEGALEPCKADDEGAQAWTVIATGA